MGKSKPSNAEFDSWFQENAFPDKKGRSRPKKDELEPVSPLDPRKIQHHTKIAPNTPNQVAYMEAIMDQGVGVVAAIGEPRSGKTLLPVYGAIEMLNSDKFPSERVIYIHPDTIDEDGVGLGYLKGGLDEKMGDYTHPFLDNLGQFMDERQIRAFLESKKVEFMLPARLRGRSFDDRCIVIADEMQNWTERKIRLLLTRPNGAKIIMTGSPDQVDSSSPESYTLALRLIGAASGVRIIRLGMEDIQSELVHEMIECLGDFGVGVPPADPAHRAATALEAIAGLS